MLFRSFVCQNNIKYQEKQPVLVLYQPTRQKEGEREILVCICFDFFSKIYNIVAEANHKTKL